MLQRIRAYIQQHRLLPPPEANGPAYPAPSHPDKAGHPGYPDSATRAGYPTSPASADNAAPSLHPEHPEDARPADYPASADKAAPSRPILVALSGGADSVALADILVCLGYPVVALHCNFHLRGDESLRDETFARTFACQTLGIPFHKTDFDTTTYAARHHQSIEMAARHLRYTWFEEMRLQLNAQAIAVAHHRDDSVETLLMNLLRGSGLRGLTGIRPRNGHIIRPLLAVSREEILAWLSARGLSYVTDSTNLSDDYTRNFIRHNVIPLLEKINPAARTTLARSAAHLASAEPLYVRMIEEARATVWESPRALSIPRLLAYPSPDTLLYELLRPYGFTRIVSEEIFRALGGLSGKQFLSPTHRLTKDRRHLLLDPRPTHADPIPRAGLTPCADPTRAAAGLTPCADPTQAAADPTPCVADPTRTAAEPTPCAADPTRTAADLTPRADPTRAVAVPTPRAEPPASYEIRENGPVPGCPLSLSCLKISLGEGETTFLGGKYPFGHDPDTAYFDYDRLRFPLELRRWQPGDRFVPFGMQGSKKVSDYFAGRKFSLPQKENAWLLCSAAGQIIWIVGERLDNRFRVTQETKNMLKVKIFRQKDVVL